MAQLERSSVSTPSAHKVGLALGSGSARGLAHIGVLRAIEEAGIEVDCIAGTSIGAVIGAIYSAGKLEGLTERFLQFDWKRIISLLDPVFPRSGLIDGQKIDDFVRAHVQAQRIEDLPIPFRAVATCIMSGEEVVVGAGDLIEAVRASISVPGIFTPVRSNGRILVDGGLVNPVPVSVARAMGAAYFADLTINRVSLFALILSLGLLVDAAIVVIENIHRRYGRLGRAEKPRVTVDAVNEIGSPTNLATLAVILVFGSLLVVSGMPGQYFYPVAFNVPVAMAASLLVAYAVVPWAANRWLKPGEGHDLEDHDSRDRLHRYYHVLMTPLVDSPSRRRAVFALAALAIMLSLFQPAWQFVRPAGLSGPQAWFGVEMAMMPKDNKNTFNITLDLPQTAPVETTDRLAREVGALLRQNPYVTDYQSWIGQAGVIDFNGLLRGAGNKQGPHVAEIRVNLQDKTTRRVSSIEIVRALRPAVQAIAARYPGSTVQLLEDPPGPPVRATVLAEIYGKDPQQLRALSEQVKAAFAQTYDMVEVTDTELADLPQHRLIVDREKAALSGLSVAEVAMALRRLIDGEELGRAHVQGEKNPVPIRLQIPRRHQIAPELLSRVSLTNRQGQRVPLSELVRVTPALADRPILRKDGERVSFVGGELASTAPLYAVLDLDRRLDGLLLDDGSRLTTGNLRLNPVTADTLDGPRLLWDGELRMTLDTYRDMLGALGLAITFIFLVLVAYYQSFTLPLVAMAAIPLGLAGVFPGHWLMGQPFNATSMIGIIALAGVVVRNSLLIIDFVLDYQRQGMGLREAILEAGAVRFRPILLTALAIVLGSAVILTDPVFGGLAVSLIFGTLASTVLTLIVIPLLLYLLLQRKQQAQAETATIMAEGKP